MAVPAPQGPMGNSAFLGAWCAQGDPTKHCSVSGNGVFLTFTNENGDTSTGHFVGMSQNVVSADQWNFVQGTLCGDGRTINWSNGTLDKVLRRRRPSHSESRGDVVSRRGPLTALQHQAEEKESSAAQRKRPGREWLGGPARPCDDLLGRNADWRNARPGWQHDLLGQRHVLEPINWSR